MLKNLLSAAFGLTVMLSAVPAGAQVTLNFAGLNGDAQEHVLDFYNGGTGSLGSTGTNYGINFSSNAIACSVQPGGNCNSAALPSGGNLLFFLTGAASTMNVAAGFDTGFSFFYSAVNNPAFVNVYDGLNGSGALLATINLPLTPNGASDPACFGANFCPYTPIGVTFDGIARSVDFGGSANQVAFANITIGSQTPGGAVPEPATWAMMLLGFGGIGLQMRRQRKPMLAQAA